MLKDTKTDKSLEDIICEIKDMLDNCDCADCIECALDVVLEKWEDLTEGKTQKSLLFHNGHWTEAHDKYIEVIIRKDLKIPKGEFSDTRIIAIIASVYGLNFLRLLDDKFVVMNRGKIIYFGQFVNKNGIMVSNDYWDRMINSRFSYYNCNNRYAL